MRSHLPRILLALVAGIPLMPLGGSAQPSAKVYRIGVLETSPPDLRSPSQLAFYEELRQRGYVEGQNLVVERRNANRQPDQLPALARELVALRPDLIVAFAPQPNRAVKDATSTIPIVMGFDADPLRHCPADPIQTRTGYSVFRYSSSASLSAFGRSVPNVVPAVAVAALGSCRSACRRASRRRSLRDEADVGLIVEIVARPEDLRPAGGRLQQVAQRGYRSVVQVRRAHPHAVEKRRVVPVERRLHEPLALDAHRRHHLVRGDRVFLVPGIHPSPVGADRRQRHAPAGLLARVAARAMLVEHHLAGRGPRGVDRKRILRRRRVAQVLLQPLDLTEELVVALAAARRARRAPNR